MANRITPKTFRVILMPFGPIMRSIFEDVFKTIKIKSTLMTTATMIFSVSNSDLRESNVVKLPGPAMRGKASGKTVALSEDSSSCLYSVIPKIISNAINNRIKAPATAKECTSMPTSPKMLSPTNKKIIIIKPAIRDAFSL